MAFILSNMKIKMCEGLVRQNPCVFCAWISKYNTIVRATLFCRSPMLLLNTVTFESHQGHIVIPWRAFQIHIPIDKTGLLTIHIHQPSRASYIPEGKQLQYMHGCMSNHFILSASKPIWKKGPRSSNYGQLNSWARGQTRVRSVIDSVVAMKGLATYSPASCPYKSSSHAFLMQKSINAHPF